MFNVGPRSAAPTLTQAVQYILYLMYPMYSKYIIAIKQGPIYSMYHNSNYAWLYLIQGNITAVPVKYALDDILVKFFWTKECPWTYVMHHVSFSSKIFAENFALGHFGSRLQSIWSSPFPRWGRTHTNSCRCEIPNCGYICKYFHPFIKYFHSAPFMKFWWIYQFEGSQGIHRHQPNPEHEKSHPKAS